MRHYRYIGEQNLAELGMGTLRGSVHSARSVLAWIRETGQRPDPEVNVVFRRCETCGMRNLVKDAWFECGVCGEALPQAWNFGPVG